MLYIVFMWYSMVFDGIWLSSNFCHIMASVRDGKNTQKPLVTLGHTDRCQSSTFPTISWLKSAAAAGVDQQLYSEATRHVVQKDGSDRQTPLQQVGIEFQHWFPEAALVSAEKKSLEKFSDLPQLGHDSEPRLRQLREHYDESFPDPSRSEGACARWSSAAQANAAF